MQILASEISGIPGGAKLAGVSRSHLLRPDVKTVSITTATAAQLGFSGASAAIVADLRTQLLEARQKVKTVTTVKKRSRARGAAAKRELKDKLKHVVRKTVKVSRMVGSKRKAVQRPKRRQQRPRRRRRARSPLMRPSPRAWDLANGRRLSAARRLLVYNLACEAKVGTGGMGAVFSTVTKAGALTKGGIADPVGVISETAYRRIIL